MYTPLSKNIMNDYSTTSDEELVKKIRTKDTELYAILVERYQKKLLRYANNLIHDTSKATDVVQDSFVKAFININSFDGKKNFSSWMYRIVHNEAMNAVKKYKKEIPFWEGFDFQSDENIEDDFEQKEHFYAVKKCLHEIPVRYSEPLILFYFEKKSYEEISDILRIPKGTVATRINRAKKLMKKLCQKNPQTSPML